MESDKELQSLLGDLGNLGFTDFTEDFFTRLNHQHNVFVAKDEDTYFIQFLFSTQVDPEMMRPKYKFMELTLVYNEEDKRFANEIMIRSARSTVSGNFGYVINHYMDNLTRIVHEWNPTKDVFELLIEEEFLVLSQKELFQEFINYSFFIFATNEKS